MTLREEIETLASSVPDASVAVDVRDPRTDRRFAFRSQTPMHAASTMKVLVLVELYRRVEAGDVSLEETVRVENRFSSVVDGSSYAVEDDSDRTLHDRAGERVSLADLARRMITVSSNLATNLLLARLSVAEVQTTVRRLGLEGTQICRGVEDLAAFERGTNNVTTAADLATVFERMAGGTVVSRQADREMIRLLCAQEVNHLIPAALPDGTRVAHKTGRITGVQHDVALVDPDGRPYVVAILTAGIADPDRSAELIRRISAAAHRAFRSP